MIVLVHDPEPEATMMARRDFAHIQKRPVIENPYWFKDDANGVEFYDLAACVGWPQEVNERGDQLPGYAAVVGVLKEDGVEPEDARFLVLEEVTENAEMLLIQEAVALRERWGFGAHTNLLRFYWGDYRQMESVVARYNSQVAEMGLDDRNAFIISPPDDFENNRAFDIYVGTLRTVLSPKSKRLFIGHNEVIKNRLLSFRRNDPAIAALGGMVHTMLLRTPWMEQSTSSVFQMPEN